MIFKVTCNNDHIDVAMWLTTIDSRYTVEIDKETNEITSYNVEKVLPVNKRISYVMPEGDKCPICYEAPVNIQTNCEHNYCLACLTKYYMGAEEPVCPYCRSKITMCYEVNVVD